MHKPPRPRRVVEVCGMTRIETKKDEEEMPNPLTHSPTQTKCCPPPFLPSIPVTCRWHVLLNLSGFWMMTALRCGSVLVSELEPVTTKLCCKLPGVQDRVWGLYNDGTEDYSGRTWCRVNGEARWLMLSLRGVRLGSQTTYAAQDWFWFWEFCNVQESIRFKNSD
jgi:hypothetical protein